MESTDTINMIIRGLICSMPLILVILLIVLIYQPTVYRKRVDPVKLEARQEWGKVIKLLPYYTIPPFQAKWPSVAGVIQRHWGDIQDANLRRKAIAHLTQSFRYGNNYQQKISAEALAASKDPEVIASLIETVKGSDARMREAVATPLVKLLSQLAEDTGARSLYSRLVEGLIAVSQKTEIYQELLKCQWANLPGEVAAQAVPMFINRLSNPNKYERLIAANGLKAIYQMASLPANAASQILDLRSQIAKPHVDRTHHVDHEDKSIVLKHDDHESSNDCGWHTDESEYSKTNYQAHTDEGYGEGVLL
jgi:hypothetical protein